jgi:hypothetical protein
MAINLKQPDDLSRELEAALGRDLPAGADRTVRHSMLRLQPVVLPPPPDETTASVAEPVQSSVTAEDDITLDTDDDGSAKRWQLLLGATGAVIALAGLAAYLLFGGMNAQRDAAVPVIQADPAAQAKGPPPALPVEPGDKSMGDVSTELVPPTTDGLSPARKISTIRIIVENDKEIVAPR